MRFKMRFVCCRVSAVGDEFVETTLGSKTDLLPERDSIVLLQVECTHLAGDADLLLHAQPSLAGLCRGLEYLAWNCLMSELLKTHA